MKAKYVLYSLGYLMAFLSSVLGANAQVKYKQCNTSILDDCPKDADCFEINGKIGECRCRGNHVLNGKSFEENDYCIETAKQKDDTIKVNNEHSTPPNNEQWMATHHQHLLGGILLPILLVLTFIGLTFLFMKFQIYQKFRNFFINRPQPTYQNVSMNNDLDDDPLLI